MSQSTDPLHRLQNWMNGNPGKNTVGFVETMSGFVFKLHYGDKTTVVGEGRSIEDALIDALDKAQNYPPAARMQAHKRAAQRKLDMTVNAPGVVKLPGM